MPHIVSPRRLDASPAPRVARFKTRGTNPVGRADPEKGDRVTQNISRSGASPDPRAARVLNLNKRTCCTATARPVDLFDDNERPAARRSAPAVIIAVIPDRCGSGVPTCGKKQRQKYQGTKKGGRTLPVVTKRQQNQCNACACSSSALAPAVLSQYHDDTAKTRFLSQAGFLKTRDVR